MVATERHYEDTPAMTETFYDVLGVGTDASESEIEAAYRERIKETHPDLSDDEGAEAATKRVIEARDVLTDHDERERYDRLGHAAYVGEDDASDVDEETVSDAASTAREAGWASGTGAAGPTNDRAGAEERRRREREAAQRVGREWDDVTSGPAQSAGGATTTGGGPASASGAASDSETTEASSAGWSGGPWDTSGDYDVRRPGERGLDLSRLFPIGESLTLLGLTLMLYPVMLASALFPGFPLAVNAVVGICTLLLVGYLQSVPEVGIVVFGTWSLVTPVALSVAGVPVASLIGVIALSGIWLPFGLSVVALWMVRL